MIQRRIINHPVLNGPQVQEVSFLWNNRQFSGKKGEMISSALFANGIHTFGHHPKDQSPQGMYCANGQCSQCLVIVDGLPVKACMTPLDQGMEITSVKGLPELPGDDTPQVFDDAATLAVEVLIIGGGPAGLSAAVELGSLGIETLIIDDKDRLGGKLVLQTHKFFGSVEDSWAGTRGFEIGSILEQKLKEFPTVKTMVSTTAVGVFSDGIVGAVHGTGYMKIKPQKLLVATGAREKMLAFPGNTLPGVYGAGAFQTLVNRDLVKAADRVLIIGGGNVGIIAGYHAIQAGIEVAAVIEGLDKVGGYKVHADKLVRLGVPIYTTHTVVSANGRDRVESVTIAQRDECWKPVPGTEKTFKVDTILVAVGLAKVDEFFLKAKAWGMDVYAAGDAEEIAEASAAMFTGKIQGVKIAKSLGKFHREIPVEWIEKASILKSRPGKTVERPGPDLETGVFPVFHCTQEIPCNPCTSVCRENIIHTDKDLITGLPTLTDPALCKGCMNCVAICPGLAATLVDYRKNGERPLVTLAYEISKELVKKGNSVTVNDVDGNFLARVPVERVLTKKEYPGTLLVQVKLDKTIAKQAVGIKVQEQEIIPEEVPNTTSIADDAVICRCERVTAGEIRSAIRAGVRDMNQLKAINRAGMGACGSKTCRPMVWGIFRDEGVDLKQTTDRIDRPLFVEVPLGVFAGVKGGENE